MEPNNNIIFFDGECLLCNRFAVFILRINWNKSIRLALLNGKTAQNLFSVNPEKLINETVIYYKEGIFYYKSSAIIEIFYEANILLKFFKIFYLVPKGIRDMFYDFIARNRKKIFVSKKICGIKSNLNKSFFLD